MTYILLIAVATTTALFLDILWLGYLAKDLYIQSMGPLLRLDQGALAPNYFAALVVYVAIIAGIFIFVLPQTLHQPAMAGWKGMLFGCITYAIYDFTNLAILAHWPWWVCFIDVLWGSILCGVTSYITAFAYTLIHT